MAHLPFFQKSMRWVLNELLKMEKSSGEGICKHLISEGWKFVEDKEDARFGHGVVLCRNELTMNMAKLAFATAGMVARWL